MASSGQKPSGKLQLEIRKNLTKINYFACDNGLGHITRSVAITKILSQHFDVHLYSNVSKLRKFNFKKKIKKKKFRFNTRINNIDVNLFKRIKKLNLKKEELIFSDNYPDFCLLNSSLIVYANFFWHEIFNNYNVHTEHILEQLKRKKIPIFGNYIFQKIKSKKLNIKKIGFIGKFKGNLKKHKNILISLGTAKINEKVRKQIIYQISEQLKKNKNSTNFYFDKIYYSKFKKYKNVFLADFSDSMFRKMSLCIGKPGMGTINDCLKYGVIFISIDLEFNKEFKINSQILKKNKLGIVVKNFKSAVAKANYIFKNKKIFRDYFNIFRLLKWNGEQQIFNFIKKNY